MIAAGEVTAGDLQVASVEVSLVQRYCTVACHLLICSASHAVVGAFHYGVAFRIGEAYRAVFGIVDDLPDACFRFDAGLVAVCIEERSEGSFLILLNGCVLVERIGGVGGGFVTLRCCGAVANVVVIVLIILAVHLCCRQFGAGIVGESIIHYRAFAGGIAGGGAAEGVVHILTLRHEGCASMIRHAREQVAVFLIALRQGHTVGFGEPVQQVTAVQVFVAEHLFRTAMQEARAVDASVCAITGRDRMLSRAVHAVDETGGTPQIIRCFGNEVSIAINRETVAYPLTIAVVTERARAAVICHLRGLPKVVVAELTLRSSVRVACSDMQTSKLFIVMRLDITASIRFRCKAVAGIVGLGNGGIIRVCLAELSPRQRMEYPCGRVFISTLARVGGAVGVEQGNRRTPVGEVVVVVNF